jgi:hypothetical protein
MMNRTNFAFKYIPPERVLVYVGLNMDAIVQLSKE